MCCVKVEQKPFVFVSTVFKLVFLFDQFSSLFVHSRSGVEPIVIIRSQNRLDLNREITRID
jgi:hypothetical protein